MRAAVGLAQAALCCFVLAAPAHAQTAAEARFVVLSFEIEGDLPISRERAQAVLAPFAGEVVGLAQLQGAAKALEAELASRGYAFYRVVLPPQSIERVVKIRVLPFWLANVSVSGNRHFSSENMLRSLPALKKGESPNVAEVARSRAAVNEHPAKNVEVNFIQSAQPDSVDAQVKVQDEPPQRIFIGLNNTGEPRTGRWRATLGYQHSNLWDRDHAVTATFTTAPENAGDVQQYGLYYRVPFYPAAGALTVFYAYSDVDSGTIANAFEVSGRGGFAGVRWRQHLTPVNAFSHALEIGVDDRFFDNDVMFGGTQIAVDVRSRPISFAYQARFDRAQSTFGGRVEYAHNLSGGGDNNDAAYMANRANASRDWDVWRYRLDGQWRVASWLLTARANAQYSDDPLIPGEQFGIGGATSVRGLREREVTGDRGMSGTLEAMAPLPWEGWFGVLFVDGGKVRLKGPAAGQPSRQDAASVGIGLRWTVMRRFSLAIDAAQVLDGTAVSDDGDRRVHASFIYQF